MLIVLAIQEQLNLDWIGGNFSNLGYMISIIMCPIFLVLFWFFEKIVLLQITPSRSTHSLIILRNDRCLINYSKVIIVIDV